MGCIICIKVATLLSNSAMKGPAYFSLFVVTSLAIAVVFDCLGVAAIFAIFYTITIFMVIIQHIIKEMRLIPPGVTFFFSIFILCALLAFLIPSADLYYKTENFFSSICWKGIDIHVNEVLELPQELLGLLREFFF